MTTIVSLSSYTGTNGQLLSAADANWSLHPLYTGTAQIYNAGVRQTNTTNALYLRSEVPVSANQTVRAFVKANSLITGQVVNVIARCSDTLNTFFLAQFLYSGGGQVKLFKFENGTATQLGTTQTVTAPSVGTSKSLQLDVSGSSPNISLTVTWDGTAVISLTNQTATGLDGAGKVGLRFGSSTTAPTDTTGFHFTSFFASDDTVAGGLTGANSTQDNNSSTGAITTTSSDGVITLSVLKNNTGSILASQTGITAHVYDPATGNKVVTKSSLSSSALGVVTFTDPLIVAATAYRVVLVMSGGAEGMETVTAT